MGRPKQLLDVGGRPLLQLVVEQACASRLGEVVVVLGASAGAVEAGVDLGRARIVVNDVHARGLSTSLRAGIGALGSDVDLALVILGDQPDVPASLLDSLLDLQAESGLPAAALSIEGLLHPPMVLSRELWDGLRDIAGDVGLRHVIRTRPALVAPLRVALPTHRPVDVDTPEDYARLMRARAGG